MRYLIACILLIACSATAEVVYKKIDEEGNMVFTDQRSVNAEEINIEPPQIISNPDSGGAVHKPYTKKAAKKKPYKNLTIVAPQSDATIFSPDSVAVTINVSPGLGGGDQIRLLMDGKEVGMGPNTSYTIEKDLHRGTHTLAAEIVSASGKKLISSPTVSFHIRRN